MHLREILERIIDPAIRSAGTGKRGEPYENPIPLSTHRAIQKAYPGAGILNLD